MNLFHKTKNLLFGTKKFFKSISKEKKYWPILLYSAIFGIILAILETIQKSIWTIKYTEILLSQMTELGAFANLFLYAQIFFVFISGIASAFALPWISAGIAHLGVLMLKGKQGFFNTFKPLTYAYTITIIYSIITIIIGIIFLVFSNQNINQITEENALEILKSPANIANLTIMFVIGIFSLIHYLYAAITGLSIYQKITKLRAFLSLVIIPLMLAALLIVLIIIIATASYLLTT